MPPSVTSGRSLGHWHLPGACHSIQSTESPGRTCPPATSLIGSDEGQSDVCKAHWCFPEVSGIDGGLEHSECPASLIVDWLVFPPLISFYVLVTATSPAPIILPSVLLTPLRIGGWYQLLNLFYH